MDILITSSYYWPELTGNAPYVTGMAEHFARSGHRVVVAAAFPHYPQWRPLARRRPAQTEHHEGVAIRRRLHYIPATQSAAKRAVYEASMFASGLTALWMTPRPDAIIGIMPSLASSSHAAVASRFYRQPYALVFHDLMGQGARQSGVRGGGAVASAVTRAELALAKSAERIAVYAEGMRRYFEDGGVSPARIDRVRPWTLSWSPTETGEEARGRLGWTPDRFICVHAGNMGHKQGLDNILDAAALISDPAITLVLAGDGNERRRLEERGREMGLKNLEFVESQPWGQYEGMLMGADVLLVNQRGSVGEMSFPSKLTSYFPAGRPIIAAVAPDADTAAEIRASKAGIVVTPDDPAALARALQELKKRNDRGASLGAAGRDYTDTTLSSPRILQTYDEFLEKVASVTRVARR
jgi:colanic acid biosynthesis glycosyl transferase WcaI